MRGLALLLLVAACRVTGTFECGLDDACRRGDDVGVCEVEGYCSFGDSSCPSGRRFADNAGADLAKQCVGETAEPLTCLERWKTNSIRFGAVADLGVNSPQDDRDPWLSPDGRYLAFSSDRPHGSVNTMHDIYQSSRPDTTVGFAAPVLLTDLSSTSTDSRVTLSNDLLTAYITSNRANGKGANDLWRSTRTSLTAAFSVPDQATLDVVNSGDEDLDPTLSSDGLHLYFARSKTGQLQRLMLATRASTSDAFGAPAVIVELDTGSSNADAALSPDELLMVFTSNRTAPLSGGNLWYTTRPSTTEKWRTPRLVPDVNIDGDDGDPILSADGCLLIFARTPAAPTPFDLVYAGVTP